MKGMIKPYVGNLAQVADVSKSSEMKGAWGGRLEFGVEPAYQVLIISLSIDQLIVTSFFGKEEKRMFDQLDIAHFQDADWKGLNTLKLAWEAGGLTQFRKAVSELQRANVARATRVTAAIDLEKIDEALFGRG